MSVQFMVGRFVADRLTQSDWALSFTCLPSVYLTSLHIMKSPDLPLSVCAYCKQSKLGVVLHIGARQSPMPMCKTTTPQGGVPDLPLSVCAYCKQSKLGVVLHIGARRSPMPMCKTTTPQGGIQLFLIYIFEPN